MKFLKSFILFFLFSIVFIFSLTLPAKSESLDDKLQAAQYGCGYPNSSSNKCCVNNNPISNIEEIDLDNTIQKLKTCNAQNNDLSNCFNDKDAGIIITLINMTPEILGKNPLEEYINSYLKLSASGKTTDEGRLLFSRIEALMRDNAKKYNNLSKKDKFKIQILNSIANEKCLINFNALVTDINGLCVKDAANYALNLIGDNSGIQEIFNTQDDLNVDACVYGTPSADINEENCICISKTGLSRLCANYISNTTEFNKCVSCTESKDGFWTGFGCIGLSFQGFIQETLFGWALGLAGIITLLCIIYAAFMLQTSAGNPERIKKARQYLTACITGLLLIIFSILILRIIGVDILKIPGFN